MLKALKVAILAGSFIAVPAAFSQTATVLSNNPQPTVIPDHPQRAVEHSMAQETSLLSTSSYSYAKGEQPLADLGSIPYETPLGDVARAYRKQHADVPKAVKTVEKQQ